VMTCWRAERWSASESEGAPIRGLSLVPARVTLARHRGPLSGAACISRSRPIWDRYQREAAEDELERVFATPYPEAQR